MRYFLSIRPGSPMHMPAPDGTTTLCGIPLVIFGRPARPDEEAIHVPCRRCAAVDAQARKQVQRWQKAVV